MVRKTTFVLAAAAIASLSAPDRAFAQFLPPMAPPPAFAAPPGPPAIGGGFGPPPIRQGAFGPIVGAGGFHGDAVAGGGLRPGPGVRDVGGVRLATTARESRVSLADGRYRRYGYGERGYRGYGYRSYWHDGYYRLARYWSHYADYPYESESKSSDAGCYTVARRVRTAYGWRVRTVEVCN